MGKRDRRKRRAKRLVRPIRPEVSLEVRDPADICVSCGLDTGGVIVEGLCPVCYDASGKTLVRPGPDPEDIPF